MDSEPGHGTWVSLALVTWAQLDWALAGMALPRTPPQLLSPQGIAVPCSILIADFGYLAFTLTPFLVHKCSIFTEDKFLHIAFQIFFAYPNTAWSSWQVYVFCCSMHILLCLASWKEKEEVLTVSCRKKFELIFHHCAFVQKPDKIRYYFKKGCFVFR